MNTSSVCVALSIFLSIFYLSTFSFLEGQCVAIDATRTTRYPIVYRRYVRRRPPMEPGVQYVDEFVEVFHTQRKPPAIRNPMSDEDIDKFIYCDFHRETHECKLYWNSKNHIAPIERPIGVKSSTAKPTVTLSPTGVKTTKGTTSTTTTTSTTAKITSTTTSATITTTPPPPTFSAESSTTSTTATSTITTNKLTAPTNTTPASTPLEVIHRIPDISFGEDNDVDDNDDDYDDGANEYADEEDQKDQKQSTTTLRNPFNLFRF